MLFVESRLTRRSGKMIHKKSVGFADAYRNDPHPFLGFLGGRLGMLAAGFDKHESTVFETDALHYQSILSSFSPAERKQELRLRAVADLSDETEEFWKTETAPSPADLSVEERIFLVDWRDFFDNGKLEGLNRRVQAHLKHYPVRVGRKRQDTSGFRLFGRETAGEHMLLIPPDLVAGYIAHERQHVHLRVERSGPLFADATARYDILREMTVDVVPGSDARQLRRSWIELEKIGQWDPDWRDPDHRPEAYFSNYDQHIRCWVPQYEALIRHCARLTQRAIVERISEADTEIGVLEIGYGTGALTELLLGWIEQLNEPVVDTRPNKPIVRSFLGVDVSDRMQAIAAKRFGESRLAPRRFVVGTAPVWADPVPEYGPFDLICGSLVLHDMVSASGPSAAEELLAQLRTVLAPHGRVIFGDPFTAADQARRDEQLAGWQGWMKGMGLSSNEVTAFFHGNRDMVETVTNEQMREGAALAGFEVPEFTLLPGAALWSPFQVVSLRRKS